MSPKRLKASRYRHDRNRSQAHILKENEPLMTSVEENNIEELNESTRLEPEFANITSDIDSSGPKLGDILPELKKMNKEIESNKNQEKEVTEVASEAVLNVTEQLEPLTAAPKEEFTEPESAAEPLENAQNENVEEPVEDLQRSLSQRLPVQMIQTEFLFLPPTLMTRFQIVLVQF